MDLEVPSFFPGWCGPFDAVDVVDAVGVFDAFDAFDAFGIRDAKARQPLEAYGPGPGDTG